MVSQGALGKAKHVQRQEFNYINTLIQLCVDIAVKLSLSKLA